MLFSPKRFRYCSVIYVITFHFEKVRWATRPAILLIVPLNLGAVRILVDLRLYGWNLLNIVRGIANSGSHRSDDVVEGTTLSKILTQIGTILDQFYPAQVNLKQLCRSFIIGPQWGNHGVRLKRQARKGKAV